MMRPGQFVRELFISTGDGSVSLGKTMKLVGFIVCTYIVLLQAHRGTLSVEVFLTYFGLVVGNDQLGKWQSIKREKAQLEAGVAPNDGNSSP